MKINNNKPGSIGDNDTFVSMIITASEDREIKEAIKTILNIPTVQRKVLILEIVQTMKNDSVPKDFIAAIAALTDEDIAAKVREVLKI